MVLSAVPPPDAKTPWLWGFQAIALTAAWWEVNLQMGDILLMLQTSSLLSLDPDASILWSKDHFKPQTYCSCPYILETIFFECSLKSLSRMFLSLEPLANKSLPHATELTLSLCPSYSFTLLFFATSQIWTVPLLLPIIIYVPSAFQLRLEIASGSISQNLLTLLSLAFQR